MKEGLIFDIKRFALHDGPGIRMTVFFKGCPLACWWCHNPEGIDPNPQSALHRDSLENRVIGYRQETVGTCYSVASLMEEIEKERLFFDDSGGGVTFSGGEPLLQIDFLQAVLEQCKAVEVHTALDTSGSAPFASFRRILPFLDLILYDLKLIDEELHLLYTGVSNRRILENLKRLSQTDMPIIIRFPIIPGITDSESNIEEILQFLSPLPSIRSVCLLPYHAIAAGKYERFNLDNRLADLKSLDSDQLIPLQKRFVSEGFSVTIGG